MAHVECQFCYESEPPCDCGQPTDAGCTGCEFCKEATQAEDDLNEMYAEGEHDAYMAEFGDDDDY